MRWSFRIGSIAGIRIDLHVTFVLFVGWIAVAQGLLMRSTERALSSALTMLLIFACVLLHELGHALAARRYGIRTRDIILLPIGGVARLERMPDKPAQEIVVALAGPFVNLVIAALAWVWLGGPLVLSAPSLQGGMLESLLSVNLLMLGFNLVPAFPMDGGRVLRALLAFRMPLLRATQYAVIIGQGFAVVFAIVGFFFNPMLMVIALFVFLAAGEEHAVVRTRASLSGLPVRAAMITDFQALEVGDPLQRAVDLLMAGSQRDFPVTDGGVPVGVLTRADLLVALQRFGIGTAVGDVIATGRQVAEAGEPLDDVLRRMRAMNRPALAVVSGSRLVGMVTLENVSELLLVQQALRRRGAKPGASGGS